MNRIVLAALAVALPAVAVAESTKGSPFRTEEKERVVLAANVPAQASGPVMASPHFTEQHKYVFKDGKLVMAPDCPYTIARQEYEKAIGKKG